MTPINSHTEHTAGRKPSLIGYLAPYRSWIILLAALFIANIALQTLAPQTLSRFIDAAGSGGLMRQLIWMILLYLLVTLAQAGASSLLNWTSEALGCRVTDDYRGDVMAHFLKLDMETHLKWRSGEVMTRLDEDVQGMYKYYHILIFKLTSSGILLMTVLCVLAVESLPLAAIMLVVSLLAIAGFRWIQERGVAKYVRSAKAAADFGGVMKEMVDNAVEVRSFAAEDYMAYRLKGAMKHRFRENFPASLMYGNLWSASTVMQGIVLAAALGIGMYLWSQGRITMGTVYLLFTYTSLIIDPLQDFRNHMGELQGARAGMERVNEMMSMRADLDCGDKTIREEGGISLDIRGLRFAYQGGEDVLRGIDLSLKPGERVCVVGETGCGKSTLTGLIARLFAFDRGEILLDGVDIRVLEPAHLRRRVACVAQSPQLIHATLRENITFFDDAYADSDIRAAAEALGLSDWLERFPNGLDTPLDMGEGSLSSGEAQLVALLRLALRKPGLVLLDEFTARMDAQTERRVITAIQALCKGRTVLAIAHRASALDWMDRVYTMENGVLSERGEGGAA